MIDGELEGIDIGGLLGAFKGISDGPEVGRDFGVIDGEQLKLGTKVGRDFGVIDSELERFGAEDGVGVITITVNSIATISTGRSSSLIFSLISSTSKVGFVSIRSRND